ncbi:MAG: phosphate ABC transporter ATP-binding protein PstB [Candidatus Limnocylindrales bacterium]
MTVNLFKPPLAPEAPARNGEADASAPEPRGSAAIAASTAGPLEAPTGQIEVIDVSAYYGTFRAVREITMTIPAHAVTAIIGPSGCGKSTFLRALNRMHELTADARVEGRLLLDGADLYAPAVDPVQLRRVVGMVFQRPNPFPTMTIYENVVAGLRLTGRHPRPFLDETVERCLRSAALWDEVKDKLKEPGTSLSGGQQQRLCIARALAVEPEVLLMDEPASALDPVATLRIEELMNELRASYTIVIVTHNMQQAARISDQTAFFNMGSDRAGYLVEMDATTTIFTNPTNQLTEDYVSGRFG